MNISIQSEESDRVDFGDHYPLSWAAEITLIYTFKLSFYHCFFIIFVILGVVWGVA